MFISSSRMQRAAASNREQFFLCDIGRVAHDRARRAGRRRRRGRGRAIELDRGRKIRLGSGAVAARGRHRWSSGGRPAAQADPLHAVASRPSAPCTWRSRIRLLEADADRRRSFLHRSGTIGSSFAGGTLAPSAAARTGGSRSSRWPASCGSQSSVHGPVVQERREDERAEHHDRDQSYGTSQRRFISHARASNG